jgi:hypothetical protein
MPELRSWITTLCGIGAVLSALGAFLCSFKENPDLELLINSLEGLVVLFTGSGLVAARDSRRSSQDVGVRK